MHELPRQWKHWATVDFDDGHRLQVRVLPAKQGAVWRIGAAAPPPGPGVAAAAATSLDSTIPFGAAFGAGKMASRAASKTAPRAALKTAPKTAQTAPGSAAASEQPAAAAAAAAARFVGRSITKHFPQVAQDTCLPVSLLPLETGRHCLSVAALPLSLLSEALPSLSADRLQSAAFLLSWTTILSCLRHLPFCCASALSLSLSADRLHSTALLLTLLSEALAFLLRFRCLSCPRLPPSCRPIGHTALPFCCLGQRFSLV